MCDDDDGDDDDGADDDGDVCDDDDGAAGAADAADAAVLQTSRRQTWPRTPYSKGDRLAAGKVTPVQRLYTVQGGVQRKQ